MPTGPRLPPRPRPNGVPPQRSPPTSLQLSSLPPLPVLLHTLLLSRPRLSRHLPPPPRSCPAQLCTMPALLATSSAPTSSLAARATLLSMLPTTVLVLPPTSR